MLNRRAYGPPVAALGSFKPSDLGASLLALWDAERSDLITQSSTLVSSWKDTVAAYDAVQAVGASKPIYSATSFNSRPGITLDGTDDELTCTDAALLAQLGGATAYEMWGVVDQTALVADTGNRGALGVGDTNQTTRTLRRQVVSAANRAGAGTGNGSTVVATTNSSVDFSGRHVVRVKFSSTETTVEIDGVTMTPQAVVPSTTATRIRLGARATPSAADFWQGVFSALGFTLPLTDARAAQMLAWGNTRRGS